MSDIVEKIAVFLILAGYSIAIIGAVVLFVSYAIGEIM